MPFRPASTAERFGFTRGGQGNPHGAMHGSAAAGFKFTTPEGWSEKPASQMRQADFAVERDPAIECYLSVVQGGIAANVIRWRNQMGLEPISPAEIAALPKTEFLGQAGVLVDLEGTFAGMGQGEPRPGYKLLGLLVEEPGQTVSLKMVGPGEAVAAERDNFLALSKSFRKAQAEPAAPESDGSLAWDAPAEWERGPDRQMRVVTFSPRGSTDTECYVAILGGSAGGIDANLNRWRDQMGQPPLGADELAALPTVKVLGNEAKLVSVTGSYTDMQGNTVQSAGLLGLVCPLDGAMLFVKMTGPSDIVEREKDRFVAFCGSLKLK